MGGPGVYGDSIRRRCSVQSLRRYTSKRPSLVSRYFGCLEEFEGRIGRTCSLTKKGHFTQVLVCVCLYYVSEIWLVRGSLVGPYGRTRTKAVPRLGCFSAAQAK